MIHISAVALADVPRLWCPNPLTCSTLEECPLSVGASVWRLDIVSLRWSASCMGIDAPVEEA